MLPQRFRRASDALQKRFTGGARAYGAHYGFPISNSPRTSNDQKWGVTLEGVDDVDGTDMTESMPDYDITTPDSFDGCADIDNPVQEHEPDPEARPHIVRTNVHSLSVSVVAVPRVVVQPTVAPTFSKLTSLANARMKPLLSQVSGNAAASEMFQSLFDDKMCEIEAIIRAEMGSGDVRELASVPADSMSRSTRRSLAGHELCGSKVCIAYMLQIVW